MTEKKTTRGSGDRPSTGGRPRRTGLALFVPLLILCAAGVSTADLRAQDRLVLLDGSTVEGAVQQIDQAGRITGQGLPEGLTVDGLRRIETPTVSEPADYALFVELAGGGTLGLTKFSMDEQLDCHLAGPLFVELKVPIDALRAVRFAAGRPEASFAEAVGEKRAKDRIFVKSGGALAPLDGLVESIDGASVAIDLGDGSRSVARERIYGIVFAQVGRPPDHTGQALVRLTDGSSLWGKVVALADGKLRLRAAGNAELSIPWTSVRNCKIRSSRMIFLSDLEPLEARHQPLVTLERPWQADKSVGGRPLTLAGRQFDKGIGVASRSVLVFANEGGFNLLAATIGIDAETEGRGDCVFIVEVDGSEKFRQRVGGGDPPRAIKVPTSGGKEISLIVEAGEDLDLSDHADWCDVRFVKE